MSYAKNNAIKVGIFTILSLSILFSTVYWLKSREFKQGKSYDVTFPDVDGLRKGAPVQLMGTQIGFVEDISPTFQNDHYQVLVRFRLTEKELDIPKASVLSIEQSGLISEKLVEISPPHLMYTDLESRLNLKTLNLPFPLELRMEDGWVPIGNVEKIEALKAPPQTPLNKKDAYLGKRFYFRINMAGVTLPDAPYYFVHQAKGKTVLRVDSYTPNWLPPARPKSNEYFTVEAPLRLKEFLQVQMDSAKALKETNDKLNALLDANTIQTMQQIVVNIEALSSQTNELVSTTKGLMKTLSYDVHQVSTSVSSLSQSLNRLIKNVNELVGDPTLKSDVKGLVYDLRQTILQAQALLADPELTQAIRKTNVAMDTVNDVATIAKRKLEAETITAKMESTLVQLNGLLEKANAFVGDESTSPESKEALKAVVQDASITIKNLKEFSEKLKGRFVLWKLAF